MNGIIFAFITGAIVHLWFKDMNLTILISVAMILNMIVAGLFGILVPITLKKFNIEIISSGGSFKKIRKMFC